MKKKAYLAAVKAAGFHFRGWLDVLPNGHELTNPVPLVTVPADAVAPEGFVFRPSTLWLVAGYHHPVGTRVYAMVRKAAQ